MAYIDCKLKSQILGTTVGVKLYFPTDLPADVGYTVKGVLTLLHGYTNSGDDWMQMTAAPRYAADNGLVLVMPDCGNSFYQNMMHGGAYKTFVHGRAAHAAGPYVPAAARAGNRILSRGFPWEATARCFWAFPGRTCTRAAPAFPVRWTCR